MPEISSPKPNTSPQIRAEKIAAISASHSVAGDRDHDDAATAMNTSVATIERGEMRAMPQMPWPEVQPFDIRVPTPTSKPAPTTMSQLSGMRGAE